MRKKNKKKDDSGNSSDAKEKLPKSDPKDRPSEPSFQFGWINIVIIFGLGALVCIKLGLFDGDNVPDFVAKRDDLEYYFKSLAAPEPPANDTDSTDGKPKRDPFAAPTDEDAGGF